MKVVMMSEDDAFDFDTLADAKAYIPTWFEKVPDCNSLTIYKSKDYYADTNEDWCAPIYDVERTATGFRMW